MKRINERRAMDDRDDNGRVHHPSPIVHKSAFTLIELLVVIAIIAILAAIILPVLDQAKQRAFNIGAVNNVRQLIFAWKMYSTDNNNYLPPNRNGEKYPSWVAGQMRGSQNSTAPSIGVAPYVGVEDYTNLALLQDPKFSVMGALVQDPRVFKDPGDQSTWADPGGAPHARVRSFSMNCAFDTFTSVDSDWLGGGYWRYYGKESDLIAPSPSDLWVFIDEHPDSINDGLLDFSMPTEQALTGYVDMPGSYHNDACAFAFADGHAEIHNWVRSGVFPLVTLDVQVTPTPIRSQSANQGSNPDVWWLAAHTTAPAPGQTPPFYP